MYEVYGNNLNIEIKYNEMIHRSWRDYPFAFCGSETTQYTKQLHPYVSKIIKPNQIINLDFQQMDWIKLAALFPVVDHKDVLKDVEPKRRSSFGNYEGDYAQDYEGYSDDIIDDAFEGDADAYWNID